MPHHPNVKVCTHIKVTGVRCGSPALRGELFCYFHQRMMRGVQIPDNARLHPIAPIENEEAIQASLMEIINAIARNQIDLRRADLILKALHIAVKNSRRVRFESAGTMTRQVPDYSAMQPATPAEFKGALKEENEPDPSAPRTLPQTTEAGIAAVIPAKRKPPTRVTETKVKKKSAGA
jgi:hypothetical protein